MKLADLDVNKIYTYADYFKWKFDERVELIKGRIFEMSPAPSRIHQELSSDIHNTFYNFLRGKNCKVYSAPVDVRLPRKSKEDRDIITVLQKRQFGIGKGSFVMSADFNKPLEDFKDNM